MHRPETFPPTRSSNRAGLGGVRASMAWLHLWAGLLPGWLLFIIFLFGTTAFLRHEIDRWMRPELSNAAPSASVFAAADALLREQGEGARSWSIAIPHPRGGDPLAISWQVGEAPDPTLQRNLDPGSGGIVAIRATRGGEFLYRFHYDLHYMPWWLARYLVCIAALAMLVAIVTGTIVHKRIFADFFLLRLGKGQRSWLDAHNVAGVLALPFYLMISYTGLTAILFTLFPWAISAHFASEDAFDAVAYPSTPVVAASGRPVPMLPLAYLVERARAHSDGAGIGYVIIHQPGDAAAITESWPTRSRIGGDQQAIVLSATTGAIVQAPRPRGAASAMQSTMIDLHTGTFAGSVLRSLYIFSGLSGTAAIATGLLLWTAKRRAKLNQPASPMAGFWLVERLNVGVIVGAPTGIATYFLANRLLSLNLNHRVDWEVNSLFIVWGAVFVWTLTRPAKRAWVEALAACAALYATVPAVSAFTTMRGLVPSLIARDWVFVGFDIAMFAIAACFALASWKIATSKPNAKIATQRDPASGRVEVLT